MGNVSVNNAKLAVAELVLPKVMVRAEVIAHIDGDGKEGLAERGRDARGDEDGQGVAGLRVALRARQGGRVWIDSRG